MKKILYLINFLFFLECLGNDDNEMRKGFLELSSLACDHDKTLDLNTSGVRIYFYDFQNDRHTVYNIGNALQGILTQNLNYTKTLVFYVPGYKSNINSPTVISIIEEFRKVFDAYLIVVDYSAYTTLTRPAPTKSYKLSVEYAFYIGRSVGLFLSGFRANGFPSSIIYGIGFSFGGQLLGYIGSSYFNETSELIGKLSAIDPAAICFSDSPLEDQIRSGVAKYVEVYHCNAGFYGSTSFIGDADFYFGNGQIQPKCYQSSGVEMERCSHLSCIKYFARTIYGPGFMAKACRSHEAVIERSCDGNTTVAGYNNPGNAFGFFYIPEQLYEMM